MSKASRQLDADRAKRNRARRRLDSRIAQARRDLTIDAITTRLTGQLKRRARKTFDETVTIADENRTIVAGTIAALAIWFLRKPLISWLTGRLQGGGQTEDIADDRS